MASVTIPSRGRIPGAVLKGDIARYLPVQRVFLNITLMEIMKSVYQSYLDRSEMNEPPDMRSDGQGWSPKMGNPDDQGNRWKQLRPSTIKLKQQLYNSGENETYLRGKSSIAAKDVLDKIRLIEPESGDGINIRTGRLLASYFPGPFINNRYVQRADQQVSQEINNISFESMVPYSNEVEMGPRPVIDDASLVVWTQQAVNIAVREAEIRYRQLQKRFKLQNERRRAKRR